MKIVIPIPPKPKERPAFGKGYTYTREETRAYEETVAYMARAQIKRPLTGAIKLTVTFYLPIPKSWSKTKKRAAQERIVRPTSRPDIDNLEKAICDALNGGIGYTDDALIVEKHSYEFYSDDPRTEIILEEI